VSRARGATMGLLLFALGCDGQADAPAPAAQDAPLVYLGPQQPRPESEWAYKFNEGQNVLPPELTQPFYDYDKEPYGYPLKKPYGDFVDPMAYEAAPYVGETVRIGFIGCLSGPVQKYSGEMLAGAQLALEEFNAAGGYFGMPFEIITRDDQARMGLDGHAMVELIYDEEVLANLGSMSSDTTHVGVRLALKAEIAQMTSISTDPTITQVVIPWAFRVLADDWSQGRAMAKLIFEDLGLERVAILERNNRYGRMGSKEIANVAQRLGHPVEVKLKYDPAEDFSGHLNIVKEYDPDALVIWGMYANASRITQQARAMGIDALIFGADGLVSDEYIRLTGPAAEGVIVTFPFNDTRQTATTQDFIRNYTERYGHRPDSFAAHGYDAMLSVGRAVLSAGERHGELEGLNRARIRDEIARTKDLPGATGAINFDHTGNDMRVVEFAVIENGRFRYLDQAKLETLRSSLETPAE
jgi:branched-chain amino acid transport system substrate-binding protein